jgi:hypothetical protein
MIRRLVPLPAATCGVDGAAHDAGVALFGVSDGPGFVDFLAGKADVSSSGIVLLRNNGVLIATLTAGLLHLTPRLCGVVFVGKAAFGAGLDLQRGGAAASSLTNDLRCAIAQTR